MLEEWVGGERKWKDKWVGERSEEAEGWNVEAEFQALQGHFCRTCERRWSCFLLPILPTFHRSNPASFQHSNLPTLHSFHHWLDTMTTHDIMHL